MIILDLNDAEADKLLVVFDPIAAMAEQDTIKLKALMSHVESDSEGLTSLLEDLSSSFTIGEYNPKDAEPPPYFPSYDEEIETAYGCPKCGYQWSGRPK